MVQGNYLRDILAQPGAVADTVAGLRGAPDLAADWPFDRIVVTGMGGSYHALQPLYLTLVEHGFNTTLVETAELIHYFGGLLTPRTLLIAVSQSGRSVEIVRLLDAAAGRVHTIGITNTPGSPLADRADVTVFTHAGIELSVSCKTYVATLVALDWLGAALCGADRRAVEAALQEAAAAAESYLTGWEAKAGMLIDLLEGVRLVFVMGRGASLAAAGAGGLILKESAHIQAEGMTCAAFRHGPIELTGSDALVLVFSGDPKTAALNANLVADVRKAGGKAFLVGPDSDLEAFRIQAVRDAIRPVLEILPVQLVSLALAALAGIEAGNFKLLTKVTTIE
jgi:glucosamine--fructose-6-phosphate aminotransferase (isomerizing)